MKPEQIAEALLKEEDLSFLRFLTMGSGLKALDHVKAQGANPKALAALRAALLSRWKRDYIEPALVQSAMGNAEKYTGSVASAIDFRKLVLPVLLAAAQKDYEAAKTNGARFGTHTEPYLKGPN